MPFCCTRRETTANSGPLARLQAETLLHVARVGALAGPLAGAEAGHQVWIAVRLPAIVDTVDDAAGADARPCTEDAAGRSRIQG